jgi:hypothetical protein
MEKETQRERLKETVVEWKKNRKKQYPFTNTQYEIPKKSQTINLKPWSGVSRWV